MSPFRTLCRRHDIINNRHDILYLSSRFHEVRSVSEVERSHSLKQTKKKTNVFFFVIEYVLYLSYHKYFLMVPKPCKDTTSVLIVVYRHITMYYHFKKGRVNNEKTDCNMEVSDLSGRALMTTM